MITWLTRCPRLLDPPGTVCIAFREWDEKYIVSWTHKMDRGGTTRSTRVCDRYAVALCDECGEKVVTIPATSQRLGLEVGHAEDCPLVST